MRPDGEVIARIAKQLTALVNHPRLDDGLFQGEFLSAMGTPDTDRYAHQVALFLSLADGRLQGCATAVAEPAPRVRNAISYWAELRRES